MAIPTQSSPTMGVQSPLIEPPRAIEHDLHVAVQLELQQRPSRQVLLAQSLLTLHGITDRGAPAVSCARNEQECGQGDDDSAEA